MSLRKTKIVSVIHGLEYKVNRQYFKRPIHNLIHPLVLWYVIKFSDRVIAPSNATKTAILETKWPLINSTKIDVAIIVFPVPIS